MQKKIALVGKSCSGKSYLIERFEKLGFKNLILYTTRPKRPNEINGKDYHFIDKQTYFMLDANNEIIDGQSYNDWIYGIGREAFYECDIMAITPINVKSLIWKNLRDDLLIIYLETSHKLRYERNITRSSDYDSKQRRWVEDDNDFNNFKDYDLKIEIQDETSFDILSEIISSKLSNKNGTETV